MPPRVSCRRQPTAEAFDTVSAPPEAPSHALIVGAGLAGAATALALVQRGWSVTLLDAENGPAQRASALPVGMLSPHVTRAPTPMSRLSALGVDDMRAELARSLRPGAGWQPCEVDNLGHDPGRWPAAMVRPAALVQAWLDEAAATGRLSLRCGCAVARLRHTEAGWQALAPDGQTLTSAPVAVAAAAWGSLALLEATDPALAGAPLPLRPVQGQMSLGPLEGPPLAERPQRDNGVFVPRYQDSGLPPAWPDTVWAMGSTYERGVETRTLSEQAHRRNAESLDALCRPAATQLRQALDEGRLLGWADVRCASLDRVPLIGAVPDVPALRRLMAEAGHRRGRLTVEQVPRLRGLYVFAALGSRGLTLSHWGAQDLARQIGGEPDPLPPDLRRAIDPARFAWKTERRQPVALTAEA